MGDGVSRRRVVIVSPYFPPSTVAGVHRARLLARHLPVHGWEPVIVCVDERHHEEPLDPELARLVPSDVRIVKVGAVPRRLARSLGMGDLSLRGWFHLRRAVLGWLHRVGAEVVCITMGPFYTSLFAGAVRRRYGVPVVLDYQDPWVSAWGATLPRWSKGGWSHRLGCWLEPLALRRVDWLTAVSTGTFQGILARHPWIDESRCSEAPIGGDPADFDALRRRPVAVSRLPVEPGRLHVSYVGTLLPRAGDTVRALLRAAALLRQRAPGLYARLRLDFVGTSNQPGGGPARVLPMAAEEGVAEVVRELPERLPYLEALQVLLRSHVVLALGSDEPHYTASKIFPVLLSERPALAMFHAASTVCRFIEVAGGAYLVTFDDGAPALAKVAEIAMTLERLLRHPEAAPRLDREALAPFLAPAVAGQFAAVFERLAREGCRGLAR